MKVDDSILTGKSFPSKQMAKQDVSKLAYYKLLNENSGAPLALGHPAPSSLTSDSTAISRLIEHCQKSQINEPQYEYHQQGEHHALLFSAEGNLINILR